MRALTTNGRLTALAVATVLLILATGIGALLRRTRHAAHVRDAEIPAVALPDTKPDAPTDLEPVRPVPDSFPRNTHRPSVRESAASGAVDPATFSAGRDLVYIDDARVWWESDHDKNDDECDHSVHRALEAPLRRLIALVCARNGVLEVQDAYRPSRVHSSRSLHKEGRAIDVTCDELGLEELAKLCWAAGFDWVYHEASAKGGPHVHASVRRDHDSAEQLAAAPEQALR